MPGQGMG